MSDESRTPAAAAQDPQAPAVDTSEMATAYANWYRVTGTAEELILDFGLTPQLGQAASEPIRISQRLVVNFYTAKRLLAHLHYAVQRHESVFGPLETDIQKRVRAMPRGMPGVGT
jgi:hypothetical protein